MPAYSPSPTAGALRQGEILSHVIEVSLNLESLQHGQPEQLQFDEKIHPLAIILTQDCDLDWDFKAREVPGSHEQRPLDHKKIPKILLCEVWHADQLSGEPNINSGLWRRIRRNGDERFHILSSISQEEDTLREGLPEMAIDFKRIFAVPTDELYYRLTSGTRRRAFLQPPFLQHLSSRFAFYCMRVALPQIEQAP